MSEDKPNSTPQQDTPLDGSDQFAVRQAKLEQIRENGFDPFRSNWEQTHTSTEAQSLLTEDMEEGPEVSVAGRIVAFRLMGKASFLKVLDRDGKVQAYVRKDEIGEEEYATFKKLDLGDFIGVSYILPNLINGSYFTGSGGTGINLSPGDKINTSQTIYIYNENFCDSNETSFNILISGESFYIPKFFTPNNDGNHDFWIVKDFTNTIKDITIFDHYGKLLKSLGPNVGWNGTFNGKPMETNDYWYVITLQTGEVIKGHFTLKR